MSRAQAAPDPRSIVTPDAFSVSPDLLGLPTANPWRRALAILIDLAIIGLLANASGLLLAVAAGLFFFRIALRGAGTGRASKLMRGSFGCLGAIVLFSAISAIWASRFVDVEIPVDSETGATITLREAGAAVGDIRTLLGSQDSANTSAAADRLVSLMSESGVIPEDIPAEVESLSDAGLSESAREALVKAVSALSAPEAPPDSGAQLALDSLLQSFLATSAAGDSAASESIRVRAAEQLAQPELAARDRRIARLSDRNDNLAGELSQTRADLEEAENRGLLSTIRKFLDDLGLGLGWSGLYFTFFTGLTRGQTPGKRLLGIRVLRLDGKPISWWISFERFGGYAAGLLTGLLGFAQILWDRNRQGVHDKLAETVVVRVGGRRKSEPGLPGGG
ncbi:MAG: RDD family protein [Gemmatimonadota bacterium]